MSSIFSLSSHCFYPFCVFFRFATPGCLSLPWCVILTLTNLFVTLFFLLPVNVTPCLLFILFARHSPFRAALPVVFLLFFFSKFAHRSALSLFPILLHFFLTCILSVINSKTVAHPGTYLSFSLNHFSPFHSLF